MTTRERTRPTTDRHTGRRPATWPAPATIRRMTEEIRRGWTEKERRKRAALARDVELLQIHLELPRRWSADID